MLSVREALDFESPVESACEGRMVVFLPERDAERALRVLRSHPASAHAARTGTVTEASLAWSL